jgi:hypothetical protein
MKIVEHEISIEELKPMSEKMFGRLVKAVVDIDKGIMVMDAGMHSDEEEWLLEQGSKQEHLWGINLYPDKWPQADWIEFDSIINIRPSFGNRTRSVDNPAIQEKIINIVTKMVKP